jgi:hypothetical protein
MILSTNGRGDEIRLERAFFFFFFLIIIIRPNQEHLPLVKYGLTEIREEHQVNS